MLIKPSSTSYSSHFIAVVDLYINKLVVVD